MFVIAHILLMYGTERVTRQDMEKIEMYLSIWRRFEKRYVYRTHSERLHLNSCSKFAGYRSLAPKCKPLPLSLWMHAYSSIRDIAESLLLTPEDIPQKSSPGSHASTSSHASPSGTAASDSGTQSRPRKRKPATSIPAAPRRSPTSRELPEAMQTPSFEDPLDMSMFAAPPWYAMPGVDLGSTEFAWANTLHGRLGRLSKTLPIGCILMLTLSVQIFLKAALGHRTTDRHRIYIKDIRTRDRMLRHSMTGLKSILGAWIHLSSENILLKTSQKTERPESRPFWTWHLHVAEVNLCTVLL